ncbi:hypothetical protein L6Q79_12565 [bacterium]|nr:hypothetical protein [bacterium]NUN45339.1 hypothetical protein [bacterium]
MANEFEHVIQKKRLAHAAGFGGKRVCKKILSFSLHLLAILYSIAALKEEIVFNTIEP